MWVEIVLFFLGVSILLYCLMAGADFGGGILETFLSSHRRREQTKLIEQALAPVWEANHVWLILAVVILFVGFPRAYATIAVSFHIPLVIMLLGVIMRGCAFTFRHYDAVHDGSQKIYSVIFMISSFVTPFFLGVTAGAMLLGRNSRPADGFVASFVSPWMNVFCASVGIYTCIVFAFLASVYLIGETTDLEIRSMFETKAKILNALAILFGILVFAAANWNGLPLARLFLSEPISLASMGLVTLILIPLWMAIRARRVQTARILVATLVALILIGWFRLQFPNFVQSVDVYSSAAPPATLRLLVIALIVGCALIFPALIYLLMIFKIRPLNKKATRT